MKLTGQKLKETREAAHLTISEVSLATKINPKVLMAMENGETDNLPAKTFLRGFVRSYAAFLKMNVAEVLALFTQELGDAATKEAVEVQAQDAAAPSSAVDVNGEGSGTFRMFILGGILVLIALIIGVRSLMQKYERERVVESGNDLAASKVVPLEEKKPGYEAKGLTPPPATEGPTTPAPEGTAPAPVIPSTVGVEVVPVPKPQTLVLKPEPAKPEPPKPETTKTEPTKSDVVKAVPLISEPVKTGITKAEAVKPDSPKPASVETKIAPPEKKGTGGARHEIILEALDKVEVSFQLRGENRKIPLAPGQVHTIVTEEPITLDVSDGGALNITDNGRDKGPAGDLGHRKQVSVP